MQNAKSNYRIDRTIPPAELRQIFDNENGQYGRGITLQYQVLSKLSSQGVWLDTYISGYHLIACVLLSDKTIDRYSIDQFGNYTVKKVPTLTLYNLPQGQFRSPSQNKTV